jgi:hypothetical protein
MNRFIKSLFFLNQPIAPLVVFRILFGLSTLISTLRFTILGWIDLHFVDTKIQFKYFGFEWIELLPPNAMYTIHIVMMLASIGIILGAWYRIAAILFFICFTYCELIDITYYLNHYYFVSLVALLMCLVPANRSFSIDIWLKPELRCLEVPAWTIHIFKAQLLIVYFYAGIAKINSDWLIHALPLKIWLPANDNLPYIGWLFKYKVTPYLFSWVGMLFDISIGYFLLRKSTVYWAWFVVVGFHTITGAMFQIGVFPLVMIVSTVLFFPLSFHQKLIGLLSNLFCRNTSEITHVKNTFIQTSFSKNLTTVFLIIWFTFQFIFPFRYLLYPGNMFWTEEGYRFGWRVMLMEKAGTATFYVTDAISGREGVVNNTDFLNPHQEKQMAMQPDMILQYAHFLADFYKNKGVNVRKVRAEVFVTLNARPSQLLIDNQINLLEIKDSWEHKKWILPLEK